MKKIILLLIVLSFSCKKKDDKPTEDPGSTTRSTTGSTTGTPAPQQTTVTVSGYNIYLLRSAHSPTINPQKPIIETSFLEKDTTYVEIFVNGTFNTAYLTAPSKTVNVYAVKMIYNHGKFLNHDLTVNSKTPAVSLTANVGDSIVVNSIYKPYMTYDASDEGKLAGGGTITSGGQTIATTNTVITGAFINKKWRQTSTASEKATAFTVRVKL